MRKFYPIRFTKKHINYVREALISKLEKCQGFRQMMKKEMSYRR